MSTNKPFLDEEGLSLYDIFVKRALDNIKSNYVKKEEGKGLSSNDYTTDEKNKLENIEENANNYVLPSDVVQDSNYVHTDNNYTTDEKNKLSLLYNYDDTDLRNAIPTKTSQLENDSGFLTEHQDLSEYAKTEDIPTKTSQLENDSGFLTEHQELKTYYQHTISIDNTSDTTYHLAFTVMSTSATAFTVDSLYSTFGSKAFACSGYYGSNIIFKLAFTSSTQARFVYGSAASTSVVTIASLTDTVITIQ